MALPVITTTPLILFVVQSVLASDGGSSQPLVSAFRREPHCYRRSECLAPNATTRVSTCLGAALPYRSTAASLVLPNASSHRDIQDRLDAWLGLRSIPRCWSVIQPLLCALHVPRCEDGAVILPTQEMCRVTRGPCRLVAHWPEELQCHREDLFPAGCKNEYRDVRFEGAARCQHPLVETDDQENWYPGIEGCGLRCQDPLYTPEQHQLVHSFVGVLGFVCLLCTALATLTFSVDWKSANKYPAVIICYINACFAVACIGWLAQFLPSFREAIVCQADGTQRHGEPSAKQNLWCVLVFVMVYYSVLAGATWFVVLAYAWDTSFRSVGLPRAGGADAIDAKVAYFHLLAWSLPLVLTIAILALGEVDGDALTGICFVGHLNHAARVGFVLGPISVLLVAGCVFLARCVATLVRVKSGSEEVVNEKAHAKIRRMIVRIGVFAGSCVLFVATSLGCHAYEYAHTQEWARSIRDLVVCQANISLATGSASEFHGCRLEETPEVGVTLLHVSAFFGAGIVASSWVWTRSTLHTWRRFLLRLLQHPKDEPTKARRHEIIARAFARRHELAAACAGRGASCDDPVAMNLDLNSAVSQEISSAWATAIPTFLMRRGAIVGPGAIGLRRHSSTSELSQRRFSLDSRRHSLDSQVSVQISEREWVALSRHQRRKTRKERERLLRAHNRVAPSQAKATKSTSTGDLPALFQRPQTAFLFSQPLRAKQASPSNPPFTHGMTDNSHLRSPFNTTAPHVNPPSFPHYGFGLPLLPGAVGYAPLVGCCYSASGYAAAFQQEDALIPLHPHVDSASETEFIPIVISESEYCTGDELQILSAQRLAEEYRRHAAGSVEAFEMAERRPASTLHFPAEHPNAMGQN